MKFLASLVTTIACLLMLGLCLAFLKIMGFFS